MVLQGKHGIAFPESYGDYPALTATELKAVLAQTTGLRQPPGLSKVRFTEITRHLAARRTGADQGRRPGCSTNPAPKALGEVVDEQGRVHAAFAEILVRTSDYDGDADTFRPIPLKNLLTDYDLTPEPVPELDHRITRLTSENYSAARMADIAAMLVGAGYQASVNQMMPLGHTPPPNPPPPNYITKSAYGPRSIFGQTGPEPADLDGKPSFRGAERTGVTVAVIDTGIATYDRSDGWLKDIDRTDDNTDLLYQRNQRAGVRSDQGSDFFDPGAGHGTFVSGVVQQVAPLATIIEFQPIDSDGVGSDLEVGIALWTAVKAGAQVVNISLGTKTPGDLPPLGTQIALELIAAERKYADSVVIVAAAGNDGDTRPVWPAAFSSVSGLPLVVAVAALTLNHEPAAWSNRGFWVDCSVPAEGVLSMFVKGQETTDQDARPDKWTHDNPWAVWTGTSFAAPQIAGAIARRLYEKPKESTRQAVGWLLEQGVSIPDFGKAIEVLPIR